MSGVISVQKLVKRYGSKTVVDGLTLEVPQGAIYAFLGDNGAGKTSTIKVLVGMHPPDNGSARILGQDCWARAVPLRNRVGYVPERPKFYEWMSVDDIGWFTGSFHRPGFLDQYRSWIKKLGLDPKKRLRDLSKGGYARVGLALALAPGPEVLILDEPTSGLDLLTRRDFLSSMVDMAGAGRTILISSHGISEVERVASHVGLIAHGKLLFSGPMDDVKRRFIRFQFRTSGERPAFAPIAHIAHIGKILHYQTLGRQVELIVQDPTPNAIDQIRDHPELDDIEVGVPTLEDIYAAVMRSAGGEEQEALK